MSFSLFIKASSNPGPACYKKSNWFDYIVILKLSNSFSFKIDGPLTITDANLVLGRLLPENFPKIFGKNQNEALDEQISRKLFEDLTVEVKNYFRLFVCLLKIILL